MAYQRRIRTRHAREMKRINDETVATARNYRKEWTGPEMELLLHSPLSARELASLLGRTIYAVRLKRRAITREPHDAFLAGLIPTLQ
jgi:hypothetical protein